MINNINVVWIWTIVWTVNRTECMRECFIIYSQGDWHLVSQVNGRLWLYLTLANVVLRSDINIKVVWTFKVPMTNNVTLLHQTMFSNLTCHSQKIIKWVLSCKFSFFSFIILSPELFCLLAGVCQMERFGESHPADHAPHVGAGEGQTPPRPPHGHGRGQVRGRKQGAGWCRLRSPGGNLCNCLFFGRGIARSFSFLRRGILWDFSSLWRGILWCSLPFWRGARRRGWLSFVLYGRCRSLEWLGTLFSHDKGQLPPHPHVVPDQGLLQKVPVWASGSQQLASSLYF